MKHILKMKKIRYQHKMKLFGLVALIVLLCSACFAGVVFPSKRFNETLLAESEQSVKLFTGDVINNIVLVNFKGGDNTWASSIPNGYNTTMYDLIDNAYNKGDCSLNSYYKTMSFNTLNIISKIYLKDEKKMTTFDVPYTEEQLAPYSPASSEHPNTSGYYDYEVCTYTSASAPKQGTSDYFNEDITTYQFSCYDCSIENRSSYGVHDLNYSDGTACICAYDKFKSDNSSKNVVKYNHWEGHIRKSILVSYILNQIDTTGVVLDSNGDGIIDNLTVIFPEMSEGLVPVWDDLLWPANSTGKTSISDGRYADYYLAFAEHGVRESKTNYKYLEEQKFIKDSVELNNYIVLTQDHLVDSEDKLTDAEGNELACNYVLAHEFGHNLGLADFYVYNNDYSSSSEKSSMGFFDLMCSNPGDKPTYMSTYNRELLGFIDSSDNCVQQLTKEGEYSLKPTNYHEVNTNSTKTDDVITYCYTDPDYPKQKIYIEYRTGGGNFRNGVEIGSLNYGWFQSGIIIYRVDENMTNDHGGLSPGNYYGYPFNVTLLTSKLLTISTGTFGQSDLTKTNDAITFQTYLGTDQEILTKKDVTFVNTGLVIELRKEENGEIVFHISGGKLEKEISLASVRLNGEASVTVEVNTTYVDSGINFGIFKESDFSVEIENLVQMGTLGKYYYNYKLKHTESGKTKNLSRIVTVQDTTAPKISLIGGSLITIDSSSGYTEQGVEYSDNYNSINDLTLTISKPEKVGTSNEYVITYEVTDKSGNKSSITRRIIIDFSSIKLKGEINILVPSGSKYEEDGIDFGNFLEDEFKVITEGEIDYTQEGTYTLTYTINFDSSLASWATDFSGLEWGTTFKRYISIGFIALTDDQITITIDGKNGDDAFTLKGTHEIKVIVDFIEGNKEYEDDDDNVIITILKNKYGKSNRDAWDGIDDVVEKTYITTANVDGHKYRTYTMECSFEKYNDCNYRLVVEIGSVKKTLDFRIRQIMDIEEENEKNTNVSVAAIYIIIITLSIIVGFIVVVARARAIRESTNFKY